MEELENIGSRKSEYKNDGELTPAEYSGQEDGFAEAYARAKLKEKMGGAIKVQAYDKNDKNKPDGYYYEDTATGEIIVWVSQKLLDAERRRELD